MILNKFKEMARDPRFIPGIHNYCDRWCEKCPLQSRCLVFSFETDLADSPGDPMAGATAALTLMGEMLADVAQEHGVTLDALETDPGQVSQTIRSHRSHPLLQAAEAYAFQTAEYLEGLRHCLGSSPEAALELAAAPLPEESADGVPPQAGPRETLELIQRYKLLICSKLFRALSDLESETADPDAGYADDMNGSAKVALMAIDRSIEAWRDLGRWPLLRKLQPDDRAPSCFDDGTLLKDSTRRFREQLKKLRQSVEELFPEARSFIRPGFDEAPWAHNPLLM